MNEELSEYIRRKMERGTDVEELKQALLSAGHEIRVVEEHINHVLKHRKLKEFIKKHVEIGTDIHKLRQYLINAGYDIKIIEGHISESLEHKKKKKNILIIVLIIAIAILVLGFFSLKSSYFENVNQKTEIKINESNNQNIEYQNNLGFFNKALVSKDVAFCDKINDSNLNEECKRKFSSNIHNETKEKISNESPSDKESKELLNKALINNNASICLDIADISIKSSCDQLFGIKNEK